jgi:hypothetical protein
MDLCVGGKCGGVGWEDGEIGAGAGTLAARDECIAMDVFGITSNITMLRITSGCMQVIEQFFFRSGSL